MTKKNNKSVITDFWFWYKVVCASAILLTLIIIYITQMVKNEYLRETNIQDWSYGLFHWEYFSFFTYQSNYIIGIFFILLAVFHNKKSFINNQNLRFTITCYITVTMTIWVIFISPSLLIGDTSGPDGTFQAILLHLVYPITMIIYTFFHYESIDLDKWKKIDINFWIYLVYPITYSVFIGLGFFLIVFFTGGSNTDVIIIFPYSPSFLTKLVESGKIETDIAVLMCILVMIIFLFICMIAFITVYITYKIIFVKMELSKRARAKRKLEKQEKIAKKAISEYKKSLDNEE